jgi:adenylate cyclase
MSAALERARVMREAFGQFLRPDVRDEVVDRFPGIGGEVQEVTVLFADIRGFTRRSAGKPPEQAFDLLHRFLTHAEAAIDAHGGWVDKYLGDGFLALFGFPRARPDHPERAVRAALDLLKRLDGLNGELAGAGEEPLAVGVGIHTGPALVGCIGATLPAPNGKTRLRKSITAIGDTVNLAQRIEQLTKTCGGPVLVSEGTRQRLNGTVPLTCLGPQPVPGLEGPVVVYRVEAG